MRRWRVALGCGLLFFLGAPLAAPFVQLARDLTAWGVWADYRRLAGLAEDTLLLVTGTLAVALPAGIVGAVLLYRTDLPLRRLFRFLTVLTLFVPLPLFASGWQAALGSGGLWEVAFWTTPPQGDPDVSPEGIPWKPWGQGVLTAVWVHAVAALPWVVWLVGLGLCWVERELEEDALTAAGPWRVLRLVTLRRSLAAVGAAALWVTLQTATEITVTDMMQVRTFAEEVYNQFVRGDHALLPRAVAAGLPSVALLTGLVLFAVYRWDRNLPPLTTLTEPPRPFPLGRLRWPCFALVLGVVAMLVLVPLVSLVYRAGLGGSPEVWSWHTVVTSLAKAVRVRSGLVGESLLLALAAGAAAAVVGLVTCWLALDAAWFRFGVLGLMAVAWALPGPVLGLGLKDVIAALLDWLPFAPLARALYYGPSPLPAEWAYLLRFFPCAVAVLWPVVRLLPKELRDTCRIDGLAPHQELRHVVWPLTRPALVRAALAVAVLCLGELGASKLVETPGSVTFAHELFSQMHTGTTNDVAALCLLLLAAVAAGGALVAALGYRSEALGPSPLASASGEKGVHLPPLALFFILDELLQGQLHSGPVLGAARHGLGELHVADAGGEVCEPDRRALADRLDELGLNAPTPGLLLRDRDLLQLVGPGLSPAPGLARSADTVGGQVVMQHALGAVQANGQLLAVRRHAAHAVDGAGPVLQDGQHLDTVRRADAPADAALRVDARRDEGVGVGEDQDRRRRPAQERLVQDAEAQHVVARQGHVLPPGQGRRRVGQGAAESGDVDLAHFAEEPALDQLPHHRVALESVGAGHDLRDQPLLLAGGGQHAVGLGGVHRHARLGQHVLAGFEGRQGDRAVQIRPGADDDGVEVRVGEQVLPALVGARDAKLARRLRSRDEPPVADRDDLNVGQGAQPGNVPQPGVGPGTDEADAQSAVSHGNLGKRAGRASGEVPATLSFTERTLARQLGIVPDGQPIQPAGSGLAVLLSARYCCCMTALHK